MNHVEIAKRAAVAREGERHMTRLNERIGGGAEHHVDGYRASAEQLEAQLPPGGVR